MTSEQYTNNHETVVNYFKNYQNLTLKHKVTSLWENGTNLFIAGYHKLFIKFNLLLLYYILFCRINSPYIAKTCIKLIGSDFPKVDGTIGILYHNESQSFNL